MRIIFIFLLLLFKTVLLYGQLPGANFTAVQTAGCSPLVVSFQDQSSGNPTAWKWDFGNGSTSTIQNPSTTYVSPGTYSITLTATNTNGSNTLTRQGYITIYDKPTVNFSADKTSGCFPFTVKFNDESTPSNGTSNVSWQWDFGNGVQSNQKSPQVTFTKAGNYTISLKVTSDKGCVASSSKTSYIQVTGGIQISFDNSAVNRCRPPFPVTFKNSTTGPGTLSYQWNFGDGSTSTQKDPNHTYTTTGNYSVSLAVTSSSGCTDTLRKQNLVAIQNISTAFTAPNEICVLDPASFSNTSTPSPQNSVWKFGDGTEATSLNAEKAFTTPGNYTVKLINNYSYCSDSFSKEIKILPRPKAQFNANNTIQCKPPLTVNFQDLSSSAVSWKWNFGDGQGSTEKSPAHTYTDYGDYTVTLIVTNKEGCTDTLVRPAFVRINKPVITFPALPQNGCIPYSTTFAAGITTLDNVTSYLWNLGDGTTSTEANPNHTYKEQGTYEVSLKITTSTGCTESITMNNAITVGRKPVIDFTASPNPVCAYQPITFSGSASEADSWSWSFGDGASSSVQSPVHTYQSSGPFNVALTVTNSGCFETLTKESFVEVKPPVSKFSFVKDCSVQRKFSFTDESDGAVSWLWDFGDGTTSTEQNPTHVFTEFGNYAVSLTAMNGSCSHVSRVDVNVFKNPLSFQSSTREACKTVLVNYTALQNNPANIVSYNWFFHNGTISSEKDPQTLYTASGNYATTLITTDIYGCKDTAHQENYIRINGPAANFSATNNNGCKGLNASFNDLSQTDGKNSIVNWKWNYGDGKTESFSSPANFNHTYNNIGNYHVQLIVTDAAGCKDSLLINNLVNTSSPKALFASADTTNCLGSTVYFQNLSPAQNYTSTWQFGDGTFSSDANAAHTYADTGAFTVQLKIVDEYGCADSLSLKNYIHIRKTVASFNVSDSLGGCTPFEVRFTNTSQFYNSVSWSFGNSTSDQNNPTSTYYSPGTYLAKLLVTGRGGCVDSTSKTIRIYDKSATTFSYTPLAGCKPLFLNASIQSPANMNYSWDFGDGTIIHTKNKDIAYLYKTFGDFTPKLIISDSLNCLLSFTGTDTIHIKGAIPKFGWSNRLLCDSGIITFTDSTTANEKIVAYHWNFGDGNTSTIRNPIHSYSAPGVYTVTLVSKTESSCSDTLTYNQLIKVVQSPLITILGDSAVCKDGSLLHTGSYLRQDTSQVEWFWAFPNGATSSRMLPATQRYTSSGNFTVTTIATNSSGCADTAYKNITVHPLPTIILPNTITTMVGTPVQIQPTTYSSNVTTYNWSPTTGLSCIDCPQPIASPKFNTLYTLVVIDSNQCRNTGNVQVIVTCSNANLFIPNTFSPNGDGSNDVFYVRGSGLSRIKSIRIFNRFGEKIFERQNFLANDPAAGWDGTFKGVKPLPDNYIYQLEVFCENSETVRLDGSIALIL